MCTCLYNHMAFLRKQRTLVYMISLQLAFAVVSSSKQSDLSNQIIHEIQVQLERMSKDFGFNQPGHLFLQSHSTKEVNHLTTASPIGYPSNLSYKQQESHDRKSLHKGLVKVNKAFIEKPDKKVMGLIRCGGWGAGCTDTGPRVATGEHHKANVVRKTNTATRGNVKSVVNGNTQPETEQTPQKSTEKVQALPHKTPVRSEGKPKSRGRTGKQHELPNFIMISNSWGHGKKRTTTSDQNPQHPAKRYNWAKIDVYNRLQPSNRRNSIKQNTRQRDTKNSLGDVQHDENVQSVAKSQLVTKHVHYKEPVTYDGQYNKRGWPRVDLYNRL